jgi:phage FluMu protein Com
MDYSNLSVRIPVSAENLKIVDGKVIIECKCPRCDTPKNINEFGLRKMGETVRRQSYCRACRSKTKKKVSND